MRGEVEGQDADGYQLLFRVNELWPLLSRQQAFFNWFTKLNFGRMLKQQCAVKHAMMRLSTTPHLGRKDNVTAALANEWRIDVYRHVLRKVGYKGSQVQLDPDRIQVSFDALTLPAVFFTVSCLCSSHAWVTMTLAVLLHGLAGCIAVANQRMQDHTAEWSNGWPGATDCKLLPMRS